VHCPTANGAVLDLIQLDPVMLTTQVQAEPSVSTPHSVELRQLVHNPELQCAVAQSFRLLHVRSLAHRGQLPPQSLSLSLPFLMPSVHLGPGGRGGDDVAAACSALCFLAFFRHFFLALPDFFLHFLLGSWAAISSPSCQPRRPSVPASSPRGHAGGSQRSSECG
jgi:hypothetical protein